MAYVDRLLGGRPDFAYATLLNGAQQLHLHRQRKISHLVKEKRSTGSRLEEAITIAPRHR